MRKAGIEPARAGLSVAGTWLIAETKACAALAKGAAPMRSAYFRKVLVGSSSGEGFSPLPSNPPITAGCS